MLGKVQLNVANLGSGVVDVAARSFICERDDEEGIHLISGHFREIMEILGLDPLDEGLKGTPDRVSELYVKQFRTGLDPANRPGVIPLANRYDYSKMLMERNIIVLSHCEHHFEPIVCKAILAISTRVRHWDRRT